jgi:hypothetical protein
MVQNHAWETFIRSLRPLTPCKRNFSSSGICSQRILVVNYRRFETTHRCHLQRSGWDRYVVPKHSQLNTSLCCVTSQKKDDLFLLTFPSCVFQKSQQPTAVRLFFVLWIQLWSFKIRFNIVFTCKLALLNCLHTSVLPTNLYLLFISHIKYSYLFLPSPLWFQNPNTVFKSIKLRSFLFYTSLQKVSISFSPAL